jgi:hypothetical protein
MQTPADNIPFINAPLEVRCFSFNNMSLELLAPVPVALKTNYEHLLQQGYAVPFPYWAQIWPAVMALSTFLDKHHEYVFDKQVLELASGLGLPSLVAAAMSVSVTSLKKPYKCCSTRSTITALPIWKAAGSTGINCTATCSRMYYC